MRSTTTHAVPSVGAYELWMLAQGTMGLVGVGGMMFLIPLYVVEQGGTPADAGMVLAFAGAIALVGPFVGSLADRFRAYRAMQLSAMALLPTAAVAFAFTDSELLWMAAAGLLGLGMAGLTVLNPTFVIAAGFNRPTQAKKLLLLQLSAPAGQVLGLASVAGLSALGLSLRAIFLVLAAIAAVLVVVVSMVNRPAAARICPAPSEDSTSTPQPVRLRTVLLSQFGLVLVLAVLMMTASQGIQSQYPNYMQETFAVAPSISASALSIMVLLSIPLYMASGRWTASAGPRTPLLFSAIATAVAGAGLLLLPNDAGILALIVFGVVMVVFPFFEVNAATLAGATSPVGAGAGQGALGAALALAVIVAAILAGWMAQHLGFHSLAAITVGSAGAAIVLGLGLRGQERADEGVSKPTGVSSAK